MKRAKSIVAYARIMAVACSFLVLSAGMAYSNDYDNATKRITTRLYEGVINCPFPYWVKQLKQLNDTKFSRNQNRNLFSLEMIPEPQEFANWTRLYGIYGFYLPEHEMKRFFDESMNALALGCKGQSTARILSAENNTITLEYYCPELRPEVVTDGNTVERAFMYISHTGKTFAKVYQAWRGSSDSTQSEDWPTNPKVQQEAIERMNSILFSPATAK